jgi:hypothetical protein
MKHGATDRRGEMTAAQFELLDARAAEDVLRWRFDELVRAGYDAEQALVVASHVEVDLHVATDLLAQGCPVGTALRILL